MVFRWYGFLTRGHYTFRQAPGSLFIYLPIVLVGRGRQQYTKSGGIRCPETCSTGLYCKLCDTYLYHPDVQSSNIMGNYNCPYTPGTDWFQET